MTRPPKNWPSKKVVRFENYSLAYRAEEKVLNDINAEIQDNEKIGIVG
jgi:ABC-type multidrug transport system fused ATPase/permease subunit